MEQTVQLLTKSSLIAASIEPLEIYYEKMKFHGHSGDFEMYTIPISQLLHDPMYRLKTRRKSQNQLCFRNFASSKPTSEVFERFGQRHSLSQHLKLAHLDSHH